jgi:hypothetical protein
MDIDIFAEGSGIKNVDIGRGSRDIGYEKFLVRRTVLYQEGMKKHCDRNETRNPRGKPYIEDLCFSSSSTTAAVQ